MVLLSEIKRKVQKAGFIIITILLLAFPYLNKTIMFKNFEPVQLLGLVIAIFSWIYIDLDKKINNVFKKIEDGSKTTLSKAFESIIKKGENIKHLRVMAVTSGTILSNIRNKIEEGTVIEKCTIIVKYNLGENLSDSEKEINNYIDDHVDKWTLLKENKSIKKIEILKYDFEPMNYLVIIDGKAVIQGLFYKTSNTKTGVYSEQKPVLIQENIYNNDRITSLVGWYDSLVKHIKSKKNN